LILSNYIGSIQANTDDDFKKNYPNLYNTQLHPKYEATTGKKWIKIIRTDASNKSVFCFVDPNTGDIYKAATWNAPAKGVRGNINNVIRPINGSQLYR